MCDLGSLVAARGSEVADRDGSEHATIVTANTATPTRRSIATTSTIRTPQLGAVFKAMSTSSEFAEIKSLIVRCVDKVGALDAKVDTAIKLATEAKNEAVEARQLAARAEEHGQGFEASVNSSLTSFKGEMTSTQGEQLEKLRELVDAKDESARYREVREAREVESRQASERRAAAVKIMTVLVPVLTPIAAALAAWLASSHAPPVPAFVPSPTTSTAAVSP